MSVSILIPCYNAAPHVAQCIESAIDQNPDEIILLNDGSTDDSYTIALEYEPRVSVWFQQKQQGAQATRNALFRLCKGDWIQYLDADDYLFPGKIKQQLEQLELNQIGCCDFRIDRGNGVVEDFPMKYPMLESLLRWDHIPQTNALLFPRAALEAVAWDETIGAMHEHKLIFDLLRLGWEFKHTPFVGFEYRKNWHPKQINLDMSRRLRAREKLLKEMDAVGGKFKIPEITWIRLNAEKEMYAKTTG